MLRMRQSLKAYLLARSDARGGTTWDTGTAPALGVAAWRSSRRRVVVTASTVPVRLNRSM